jgi:hypothetical protein
MAVGLRGERDRDRVVVRCLLAVRWSVNVHAHKMTQRSNQRIFERTYDLARVLRRLRLRRRTRFFLHLALAQ